MFFVSWVSHISNPSYHPHRGTWCAAGLAVPAENISPRSPVPVGFPVPPRPQLKLPIGLQPSLPSCCLLKIMAILLRLWIPSGLFPSFPQPGRSATPRRWWRRVSALRAPREMGLSPAFVRWFCVRSPANPAFCQPNNSLCSSDLILSARVLGERNLMPTSARSCDKTVRRGVFVSYALGVHTPGCCKKHVYFSLTSAGLSLGCCAWCQVCRRILCKAKLISYYQ